MLWITCYVGLSCNGEEPRPSTSLTNHSKEFVRLVNLESLMPHLCQRGLLGPNELEWWLNQNQNNDRNLKVLHMLTILNKKGKQGVHGVIQALKDDCEHMGHDELASMLEEAYGFQYNKPLSSSSRLDLVWLVAGYHRTPTIFPNPGHPHWDLLYMYHQSLLYLFLPAYIVIICSTNLGSIINPHALTGIVTM